MTNPNASSELIVYGERLYTNFEESLPAPGGNAILLRGGRVTAIGSLGQLRAQAPRATVRGFPGGTITPGFIDSHIHLLEWAGLRGGPDLTSAGSPEEAADRLFAGAAPGAGDSEWVTGHGWSRNRWGRLPHRSLLDRYFPDRPVAVHSQDLHSLWVNSRALELAGLGRHTADPLGGTLSRDDEGNPTGVLFESAMEPVRRAIPPGADAHTAATLIRAQRALHALGITGVHSFPGLHSLDFPELRVFQRLRDEGRLRLRILQQVPADRLEASAAMGLGSGSGDDWVRIGGLKLFLDGSLGSRTAWIQEPYLDGSGCGIALYEPDEFRAVVRRAAEAGFAATVHAIGDAAVGLAIDTLADATLPATRLPHRIEHVQLFDPEQLTRLPRGMVCSVQPAHLMTDWAAADRYWGSARSRCAFAFRSLARAGGLLAFGSDAPVADPDPRHALMAATERRDLKGLPPAGWHPGECLNTREALWAYTGAPAAAAGMAGLQGALLPGACGDLVVWNQDPLHLQGAGFLDLEVRATVSGGVMVWSEEEA